MQPSDRHACRSRGTKMTYKIDDAQQGKGKALYQRAHACARRAQDEEKDITCTNKIQYHYYHATHVHKYMYMTMYEGVHR